MVFLVCSDKTVFLYNMMKTFFFPSHKFETWNKFNNMVYLITEHPWQCCFCVLDQILYLEKHIFKVALHIFCNSSNMVRKTNWKFGNLASFTSKSAFLIFENFEICIQGSESNKPIIINMYLKEKSYPIAKFKTNNQQKQKKNTTCNSEIHHRKKKNLHVNN